MQLKSRNRSDWMRRQSVAQQEIHKRLLITLLQDQSLSSHIREIIQTRVMAFSRNIHSIRIRNRCIWTGRSRGILKHFRCSRIVFRELAGQGRIPGIRKASW